MIKVKVSVTMIHGKTVWGYIFLEDDQRSQDLLNDERKFIPLNILRDERGIKTQDEYKIMMIHKDSIMSLEEL